MAVDLIARAMAGKGSLVSGETIKTLGGQSLLGAGDIPLYTGDITPNNIGVGMNLNITKILFADIRNAYTDGCLLYVVPKNTSVLKYGGLYTGYSIHTTGQNVDISFVGKMPLTPAAAGSVFGTVKIDYINGGSAKVTVLSSNIFTDKYPTITTTTDTQYFTDTNFDFYVIK